MTHVSVDSMTEGELRTADEAGGLYAVARAAGHDEARTSVCVDYLDEDDSRVARGRSEIEPTVATERDSPHDPATRGCSRMRLLPITLLLIAAAR